VIGNAIHVVPIATGEAEEDASCDWNERQSGDGGPTTSVSG
jgi:hypothetical protein